MRKGTFIIFVLVILGLSNCAFESQLAAQFQTSKTLELRQNSLGKAILSMVNMFTREKRDMSDLFNALEELKQQLNRKQDEEDTSFDTDGKYHVEQIDKYNDQIKTYKTEEATLSQELDTLRAKGDSLQNDLKTLVDFVALLKANIVSEQDILKNLKTEFDSNTENFNVAVNVLKQATGKLTEALESSNSAFSAFVQKNQILLQKIQISLETNVNKMMFSPVFTKPISNIFAQLQEGSKLDENTIQKALNALRDLIIYFENGQEKLGTQFEADKQKHENLMQGYFNQQKIAEFTDIPYTQTSIATNKELQSSKDSDIKAKQSDIKTTEKNLEGENKSWEQRVEIHNELVQQFAKELSIVVQAVEVLSSNFSTANLLEKSANEATKN